MYSIGLLLYAGVTGGLLPFFARAGEHDERAARLGAAPQDERERDTYPAAAGEKLARSLKSA